LFLCSLLICYPHQRYVGWSCVLDCFMLSSLLCLYAFCWSAIPTSCYIFNVFNSCPCRFFLAAELKFAIYYRVASLPSQASYALLAEESQAIFYISLLSDLWACVHGKKNGVVKEAIVLRWVVRIASCDFKPGKKRWAGALLSGKCCCFVQKPSRKSHANLN